MSALKVDDLGRVLQVEYDYTYKANDGKFVTIKQGEEYILVKKSNADWWQVIRLEQKKPFYIPASYVKELPRKTFPDHTYFRKAYKTLQKSLKKTNVAEDDAASVSAASTTTAPAATRTNPKERTIYLTKSREDLNVNSLSDSKLHVTRASTDSLDRFIENENPYDEVPLQVHIDSKQKQQKQQKQKQQKQQQQTPAPTSVPQATVVMSEPEYENLETIRQSDPKMQQGSSNALSPPTPATGDEPMGSSHRHSSTSNLMMSTFKPKSPNHASRPPDDIEEGRWEVHLDHQTGTNYLYNNSTGEMRDFTNPYSSAKKKTKSKHHASPPPLPDASKKPVVKSTVSPPASTSLQRRLSSPARYRSRKNWPVAKYRRNDLSPSPSHSHTAAHESRSKVAKDNNHHPQVPPAPTDVVFHDSTNHHVITSTPNSTTTSYYDVTQQQLSRTLSEKSRTTSSGGSPGRLGSPTISITTSTPSSPTGQSAWYQDSQVGSDETVWVNSVTGERWHQMLDDSSHQFYYFNEISRETAWQLPQTTYFPATTTATLDAEEPPYMQATTSTISTTTTTQMKKSHTLEREIDVRYHHDHLGQMMEQKRKPSVNLRPHKLKAVQHEGASGGGSCYTKSLDRNLHARSMIILRDDPHHQQLPFQHMDTQSSTSQSSTMKSSLSDHHFLSEGMIQRQGRLNWTKLYEAGKKQRKNWTQQWVVLLANNLLFYKDQKQAAPTKTFLHGKPESSCDLRAANIGWASPERSSKKNVVELQTVRGLQLLVQHDDIHTVQKWLETIKSTIDRVNQNDPIDPTDFSKSVEEDDTNTENTTSSSNDTGKNKKKKDKKKSKAPSRHGSDAKNSDKVRNKLKKFIGKRPTFESLQERGIIKETVFGCPLDKLCEKEQTPVPKFVQLCVDEVEKRGLDVDGIYRVSGNLSHVQRLRYLIDRDETPDLGLPEWEDIHLITGALKMFLRELPEPVIPFNFFDKFIAACKLSSEKERVTTMKGLVKVLPRANSDTLKYLLEHFRRVVEHSHQNRMLVQNIAIVFGPTLLLKPPDTNPNTDPMAAASGGHMAVYMVYQNQIIDTMLTEYLTIFH